MIRVKDRILEKQYHDELINMLKFTKPSILY
jgi:hypothetical protein